MRKLLLTAVLVALCAFSAWGLDGSDYVSGRYFTTPWGTVLAGFTSTGLFDLIGGARFDNVTSSSVLTITENTIGLVGDAYNYGDSFKIGYDSGAYISFAVADTTGNVTITHAGSTKNVSWTTAGSFTLSAGSFALTAASQTFTASTAWYGYTPAFYIGYDSGAWLKIAVADTTGNVTITQTGSGKTVTWTQSGITLSGGTVAISGASGDELEVTGTAEIKSSLGLKLTGVTTATWDPASLADGAQESKDVAVTGAAVGDFVLVAAPVDVVDLLISAQVTAADTVTITIANETGGAVDLASGDWKVFVIPSSD